MIRTVLAVFGALVLLLVGTPLATVLALRWLPPPTTAFMLQSEVKPVRYQWVPAAKIAAVAGKAVVASEDQKFWEHDGFDFEAIEEALELNKRRRKQRGASTISQQTAKNLFLWPGGGYFRKGVEAGFTVLIEWLWPKQRILEVYLNIAEFGPGIYGVEAASQAFFKKPAAALAAGEAARLAAVLPSPRRWRAANPGPYVQSRTAWVLRQIGYGPRRADPTEEPPEPPAEDLAAQPAEPGEAEPAIVIEEEPGGAPAEAAPQEPSYATGAPEAEPAGEPATAAPEATSEPDPAPADPGLEGEWAPSP